MDTKLNYQQAKQVRERSIKDLIADELIRGKGVGGAIKGAFGLRTQAKIKGIKEKFDPLNIVKFLTFGSRLGPALYGKLFGRSRKDIEYFTGRASAIGERKKKITGLSGEGEDTGGMKEVLNQILTYMQKTHEDDMILREKENNLRESAKLADDRRHKDLLKALGAGGQTGIAQKIKDKGNDFLSGIMNIINGLKQQIQSFIDDFKNIKNILTGFNWLSKLSWLRYATNPYVLATMLITAGLFKIYNNKKEIEEAASQGDVEKLKGYFSNSGGSDEADVYAGGISGYNKESVKGALEAAAAKGSVKAQETLNNFDNLTAETVPVKTEKQLMDEYLSKKGFYDAGNGNYKGLLDSGKKPTQADFDAAKAYAKSKMASPASSTTPSSTLSQSSSTPQLSPASATPAIPTNSAPAAIESTPKSAPLSSVTNMNLDLQLEEKQTKIQEMRDKTNIVNNKIATGKKVPLPLVRNKDETFQRLIYNSTRIV